MSRSTRSSISPPVNSSVDQVSTENSLESAISAAMAHVDSKSNLIKPENLNAADVAEIIQLQASGGNKNKKETPIAVASSSDSLAAAIRQWNKLRQSQKRSARNRKSATLPSRSERAGINFPVGRVTRQLKKGQYSERIGGGAPIYVAAVLEYLTTELLDLAGHQAKKAGGRAIQPLHLAQAMNEDQELRSVMEEIVEHKKSQEEAEKKKIENEKNLMENSNQNSSLMSSVVTMENSIQLNSSNK